MVVGFRGLPDHGGEDILLDTFPGLPVNPGFEVDLVFFRFCHHHHDHRRHRSQLGAARKGRKLVLSDAARKRQPQLRALTSANLDELMRAQLNLQHAHHVDRLAEAKGRGA